MNRRSIFKTILGAFGIGAGVGRQTEAQALIAAAKRNIYTSGSCRAMGFDPGFDASQSVYTIWSATDDGVSCRQVSRQEFESFFNFPPATNLPKPINGAWIKAWEEGNKA